VLPDIFFTASLVVVSAKTGGGGALFNISNITLSKAL